MSLYRALKTYLIISILIFSFLACNGGNPEGSGLVEGLYYRSNEYRGDTIELTKSRPKAPGWNLTTWEFKKSTIEISDGKDLTERFNRKSAEYFVCGDSLTVTFSDKTLSTLGLVITYEIISKSSESIEILETDAKFNE